MNRLQLNTNRQHNSCRLCCARHGTSCCVKVTVSCKAPVLQRCYETPSVNPTKAPFSAVARSHLGCLSQLLHRCTLKAAVISTNTRHQLTMLATASPAGPTCIHAILSLLPHYCKPATKSNLLCAAYQHPQAVQRLPLYSQCRQSQHDTASAVQLQARMLLGDQLVVATNTARKLQAVDDSLAPLRRRATGKG
jgi:hypothetical protein